MSALQSSAARSLPVRPTKATEVSPPRLRVVESPGQERSATWFIIACVSLLLGAIVSVLLMNTEMTKGAYTQRALNVEISNAAVATQTLEADLDEFATPANLAARAAGLGMVQMVNPGVISLAEHKVIIGPSTPEN